MEYNLSFVPNDGSHTVSTKTFNNLGELKEYITEMEQKEKDEKHQEHIRQQKHLVKNLIESAFKDIYTNRVLSMQSTKEKVASDILMDAVAHWYSFDRSRGDPASSYFTVPNFIEYISSRNHAFELPWNSTSSCSSAGYLLSELGYDVWLTAIMVLIVTKRIELIFVEGATDFDNHFVPFVIVPGANSGITYK